MDHVFHARSSRDTTETFGDARVSLGNRACGVFAEWNWDGEQLTLTNDRYGFFPIYYFRRENEFAVSPSISKLLELVGQVEFDDNAFSVLLRFGWLIAEDTLFRSIRAVPAGSTLTWHRGDLQIESAGIINQKPLNISRAEAVETYADLFQRSIETTLPPNDDFFVPLSGGRDSRHILFAVCKANRKPTCLTIIHPPPRPNEDTRISRQICETLKLEHELLDQSRSRFDSEIRKNELSGFCASEHGWFFAVGGFRRGKKSSGLRRNRGRCAVGRIVPDGRTVAAVRTGKARGIGRQNSRARRLSSKDPVTRSVSRFQPRKRP